ncbi:MAG: GTPase HflX [Thermodesulfobacteriota bacterium]|nr:GTPase HflX [Thermodesulfobacteriota bacterium]
MQQTTIDRKDEKIKALLIGICLPDQDMAAREASIQELERLADTAGMATVGKRIQRREKKSPRTYAGEGFIEKCLEEAGEEGVDILIFDNDLTGSQARNIERMFSIEAIDRTEAILRIFHDHAKTKEARLQVRLAELKYELPRLRSMWTHLDRERFGSRAGAGVAFRGMGEKQSEKDRQRLQREIYDIEKAIDRIIRRIDTQRKRRERDCRNIGLVGYTNAGKSTLFNRLTHAHVLVEDRLFATLDSTARSLSPRSLNHGTLRNVVISDTVGFISNLPHHLIASFRATLREAENADLLLNVIDISDDHFESHMEEVDRVLREIGAGDIPQLLVFNKMDRADTAVMQRVRRNYPEAVLISASRGDRIENLLTEIHGRLNAPRQYRLSIPQSEQRAIHYAHSRGRILKTAYDGNLVKLTVEMGSREIRQLEAYVEEG